MLISAWIYVQGGGCQRYKALLESAEPFVLIRLLTSARLLYEAGFVLTYKTRMFLT